MTDDEDFSTFGDKLKVEISVKCGQISEVALTTLVELNGLDAKSSGKLRDTIMFLRNALPLTEIRSEDREHGKQTREPAIGPDGKLTLSIPGLAAARAGQEDLKKLLGEQNGNVPVRPDKTEKS